VTTESEIKLARYSAVEREADALGRVIGVHRLKPSQQTKLVGMTQDLPGFDIADIIDEDGSIRKIKVPHRGPLLIAAAVCEINEAKIPFPANRGELDSIYDRLDIEGLQAAVKALTKLNAASPAVDQKELAKN